MRLVIVRHGQSANNAAYAAHAAAVSASGAAQPAAGSTRSLWEYEGRVPDPPLTDLGVRQAQALGDLLAGDRAPFAPTHLYSSLTTRAVQTARPLAEATGLPVVLRPDLHEVGGIHQFDAATGTRHARPGATLRALRAVNPAVVAGPDVVPGVMADDDAPWPGGLEPRDEDALPRALALLADLRAAHGPDDVVVLVSHQYFAQFLLAPLVGFSGPPWQRFRIDNTAHASLHLQDDGARVAWVNRHDHLAPGDVTN